MTAHARRQDVPEGLASALRREPWAEELGVEYLELGPGLCRVALSMTISFLAPDPPGARLVAEARERRHGRRARFYDVTVTTHAGAAVATVHCVAHRVGSP